nr:cilia- and flagella-associated protein 206-like isoform X1 [Physcomitrium patens]|eukprot:XP_024387853.1 cilia- and flagella-associated protein 206-like isoform X1 [Physcomitrella patens]
MNLELEAALESVFPRKGFLYWMDLPKEEKMLQLQELAEVVTGVRVFNKYEGKGGQGFQLPNEVYEHDAVELGCAIQDTFEIVNTKIRAYSSSVMKYYQDMGVNHIFIKRLRDEISYQFQVSAYYDILSLNANVALYLEPVREYLCEKQEAVLNLLEKSHGHLDRLSEIIGSYEVIPSDMVFPELRAIGAIHIAIAQEFRHLQARIKAATPLLKMAQNPFYRESPHTEKRLDIKRKNFLFLACEPPQVDCNRYLGDLRRLSWKSSWYEVTEDDCKAQFIPPNEVRAVMEKQPHIEYNGFCPVCFSRTNGILWKGDPDMGLVQTVDKKLYCFGDEDSQKRFLKAPCKYIADVAKLVLEMPQHVHLMNLEYSPAFYYLSIPKILETELVNESLPKDFGIQTEVHPWMCRWDRQELEQRKLEWQKLRTHFTQTDVSHFRRENITQTYPPKDMWTNTGISRFTNMPSQMKELHDLRGHLHNKMHSVRSTYEHTSVHNPWKEKPPPIHTFH